MWQAVIDHLFEMREKGGLKSPGTFENLHSNTRMVFPTQYVIEGAKFELNSQHNQNFQTSHSFGWGATQAQSPSSYNFAAVFANTHLIMQGTVDHQGTLQARGHYNWIPIPQPEVGAEPTLPAKPKTSATSKLQAQLSNRPGMSAVHLEHEYVGLDYSIGVKMANANPIDAAPSYAPGTTTMTGLYSISYLQALTKKWAFGAEWAYQRPYPDLQEASTSFGIRYVPTPKELPLPLSIPAGSQSPYMPVDPEDPTEIYTATFSPASSIAHLSYWRRLNQRLEVAADVQMLCSPSTKNEFGRREAVATVGFKLDTVFASIRSAFESTGKLTTVLEEKITPNMSFQLNGEIDYVKGGTGRVGFGFTFEQ